jgi:Domain of unknown function (DUF5916)
MRWLKPLLRAVALAAPATAAILESVAAQTTADRSGGGVRVRWTATAITLDGELDEPAWRAADSVSEFTQLDPDEGEPASERTAVRFLATAQGLYVGLAAFDRAPARVGRAQLRRDADFSSDDSFTILLDPQQDRRTGYLFGINPNGARYDAEIQGPDDTNDDWDGRWDARAQVTAWGWSAEIWLPWETLRYRRGDGAWGLNMERFIRRRNEVVLWRGWRRHQGLLFQEAEGTLAGLDSLPERPRAEIRPYVLLAQSQAERLYAEGRPSRIVREAERDARVGGDAKLAPGPTLTLDLTANSDFAQVEVDERVVNLTRFPLHFPEKRPFFLENSGIFALGEPGEAELFYSRRIGLADDGTPLPIDAGARLHGRSGEYRIGALAVRTGGAEDATDVVARITRDVHSRGRVGFMLASRYQRGRPAAPSAGLDAELPFLLGGQNLVLSAYGAAARADGEGASAWGLFADYPNDWSDIYLGVSRIGEGFEPALGFVREDGLRRSIGGVQFFPRPRWPGVRRLNLKVLEWEVADDFDGRPVWAAYEIRPFGIELEGGEEVELNFQQQVDVPDQAFEIFPGSVIRAGHYRYTRVEVRYLSAVGRRWTFDAAASAGGFYDGTSTELKTSLEFRSAPHLIAFLDYGLQDVRRPGGNFVARVARVGLDLAANPRLGGSALVQWENESERLTTGLRVHWAPRPGTDAYLAWNSAWPTALESGVPWRRPEHGQVIGKLVHYLRW